MILPIQLYPEEILRRQCRTVTEFDDELRELAASMIDTMHAAPGVGLAAPQVGRDLRLAVVDVTVGEDENGLIVLVNPEIVESDGRETDIEGCLSIPDFTEKVERPASIVVHAHDLEGTEVAFEAEGFVARAICHEIDHLNGVLFVDHLRGLRRDRARRHLRRLKREAFEVTA